MVGNRIHLVADRFRPVANGVIAQIAALILLFQGCATAPPRTPALEIQLIEFGDHPDPNTGALRLLVHPSPWPAAVHPLMAAVAEAIERTPSLYDIRRAPLAPGEIATRETTARVLEIGRDRTHLSVVLDAAPAPFEVSVPTNATVVIGSETPDQRHAFVAISVLDREAAARVPEIFTTTNPEVKPPVKISGAPLQPTPGAVEHRLKGMAVEVEIDQTGNVTAARAIVGRYPDAIDTSAVETAVRSWKFAPATHNGKPVTVITDIIAPFAF